MRRGSRENGSPLNSKGTLRGEDGPAAGFPAAGPLTSSRNGGGRLINPDAPHRCIPTGRYGGQAARYSQGSVHGVCSVVASGACLSSACIYHVGTGVAQILIGVSR